MTRSTTSATGLPNAQNCLKRVRHAALGVTSPADRQAIAVAGHADIGQVAVRGIRARRDRRHAAVNRIEAMRLAHEIRGRLRRAADAAEFRRPVRRNAQLECRLHDRAGDRIMAAAGA